MSRERELRDVLDAESRKRLVSNMAVAVLDRVKAKEGVASLNRRISRAWQYCIELEVLTPRELFEAFNALHVKKPRKDSRAKKARRHAIELLAANPALSNRKLARECKATLPTIRRWKSDSSFKKAVEEEIALQAELIDTTFISS